MKKFGLLFILLVVSLSLFSACKTDDEAVFSDGESRSEVASQSSSGFFAKLEAMSAKLNSYQAEQNFAAEFAARIENSPLHALNLLEKSFMRGTTTVNANAPNFSGNFTLQSDVNNFNFALLGDMNSDGENFDFSAFLNRDRAAVGSNQLDDSYGIDFRTLAQDLASLVGELGIPGIDEFFQDVMDAFKDYDFMPYLDVVFDYAFGSENITDNVEIVINGETVSARRVSYDFSGWDTTLKLYQDWFDIMENDEAVVAIFDNPFVAENLGLSRSEIMSELRRALTQVDMSVDMSDITMDYKMSYYIGAGERLLRFAYDFDFDILGDAMQFKMTFDTGNSATDTWRIDIDANIPNVGKVFAKVVWNVREEDGNHIHEFDVTAGDGGWLNLTFLVTMDWNPETGDFVLANGSSEIFRGNFKVSGDTFNLRFNVEDVSFEMSTTNSVNIGNVDFVNIMDMGAAGLGIFQGMLGGMTGGGSSWDYDDFDWENFDWENYDWDNVDWDDDFGIDWE
jgi:hypothetical protein